MRLGRAVLIQLEAVLRLAPFLQQLVAERQTAMTVRKGEKAHGSR
jgi:hypothetical protein